MNSRIEIHPAICHGQPAIRAWRSLLPALALGALASLPFAPTPSRAATATVGGVTWRYDLAGNAAVVTGANPVKGKLSIPAALDGHPVKSIAAEAFFQCTGLTGVTIPITVTNIGFMAFYQCTGLTGVTIPDSVTDIVMQAFYDCSGLTSVKIGNRVRSIGDHAFMNCRGLASVTIPDSVTSIGSGAFEDCSGLKSVTIGSGVTNIGSSAFDGCSGLTSVTIPDGVTRIEFLTFGGCIGLTSVAVPDSVTGIDVGAFFGCSGLTSVAIPDSVTSIGGEAFYDCSGLKSVTIPACVLQQGITNVFSSAYWQIEEAALGNSVTNIGNLAFYGCIGLTRVAIPDSVTGIGDYAFAYCRRLESVTIPASVTSIGNGAFYNCSGLTTLYVPIAWKGTDKLESAGVPTGCTILYFDPASREETSESPVPVPFAWLEGNASAILAEHANDYEAAAAAPAANGRPVWECYVAGLGTTNAVEEFTTVIMFSNGVPKVSWVPDLNEGGTKKEREYVVEGKPGMMEEWGKTNSASRFFRVKVGMPE